MKLLRDGKRIGTSLLGNQEMRFMWNLAFCIAIAHHGASFRAYYTIRSFITFHGIFMAPGYGMGEDSVYEREQRTCIKEVEHLLRLRDVE